MKFEMSTQPFPPYLTSRVIFSSVEIVKFSASIFNGFLLEVQRVIMRIQIFLGENCKCVFVHYFENLPRCVLQQYSVEAV